MKTIIAEEINKVLNESGFIDKFRRTKSASSLPSGYYYDSGNDEIYYKDENGGKHYTGVSYGKENVGKNWNLFSRYRPYGQVSERDNERARREVMKFDRTERPKIDNEIRRKKEQERAERLQGYRNNPDSPRVISVPRRASGSFDTRVGQETLMYTDGISDNLRGLGSYLTSDNPKLSRNAASLIWIYSPEHKVYRMSHIQGSQKAFPSLSRYYNFVGNYEISEEEMEMIENSLSSLMGSIPRISQLTPYRKDTRAKKELEVKMKKMEDLREDGLNLKNTIETALMNGNRLIIKVNPTGANIFGDGIFECKEFNLLVSVIDHLDPRLRTSATFAFCADDQTEPILKEYGIRLIFHLDGVNIKPSAGDVRMTWEQAVSGHNDDRIVGEGKMKAKKKRMKLTEGDLRRIVRKAVNGVLSQLPTN